MAFEEGRPLNKIAFEVCEFEGRAQTLEPFDDVPLSKLVADFEHAHELEPAGGYTGIVPQYFGFGDLSKYYAGDLDDYWEAVGKIAVLGCTCGEVGCWPLYARVESTDSDVTWKDFEQPHRLERDYSGFGPFVFDLGEYKSAVETAVARLNTD